MLKKLVAKRLLEVESEWPKGTIFDGPDLAWKLCSKCNFMQKAKIFESGGAFAGKGESGENGWS